MKNDLGMIYFGRNQIQWGFYVLKNVYDKTHEMVYVLYEILLLYDISSHNHKFVKMLGPCTSGTDHPYGNTTGCEKGCYDPPLPSSVFPFKSERGKHKTQKPTSLMEWISTYYSKEGDTVLDSTMGSGSMGVACKSMNR